MNDTIAILGQAIAPTGGYSFLAQWLVVGFAFISGIGGLLASASYFATRREVDDIKVRLVKVEDVTATIRDEMRKQKDELVYSADRRASVLHNRINPIVENLAALKGSNEAFVGVFSNFTEVMRSWCARERDTTVCPNQDIIEGLKKRET